MLSVYVLAHIKLPHLQVSVSTEAIKFITLLVHKVRPIADHSVRVQFTKKAFYVIVTPREAETLGHFSS